MVGGKKSLRGQPSIEKIRKAYANSTLPPMLAEFIARWKRDREGTPYS